ncbi:MAG: tetratricopeptide repeat protein [Bacteroidetes bacterium]|nr:tetratricopeptide repeat protein [Bacteroidota bacterium]
MEKKYSFILYQTFIVCVFSLFSVVVHSQTLNLNSAISYYDDYIKYNELKSLPLAKARIDSAAKNPTTMDKYKTWFYRGLVYMALFDNGLKNEMSKISEKDINKRIAAAYQVVSVAEVDEALRSFQKEISLDDKKIYTNEANTKIRVIASIYSEKAYSYLINKNYIDAITYYEKSYDVNLRSNVTDTVALNNLAISALKMKDFKKAEQFYAKLLEIKYKPETSYLSMIQMYYDAGDTASVKRIILQALAAMPESYLLIIEKINFYLKAGKYKEAILSINQALAKNPNNHELHLVLGQTYNKIAFPKDAANKDLPKPADYNELLKKAEGEFNKAIEIKADYFLGLYTQGVFYSNLGGDILKQSDNIKDPKKVKIEEDKADTMFQKAIPILEKAHALDSSDKDTMRTLRQLYARTGQGDSEKYKKLNEELKGAK